MLRSTRWTTIARKRVDYCNRRLSPGMTSLAGRRMGIRSTLFQTAMGFLCLWGQPLDSRTKQPVGSPFDVYHFHSARRSLANQGLGLLEISVARDKIVFSLDELAGNIWMTELENP